MASGSLILKTIMTTLQNDTKMTIKQRHNENHIDKDDNEAL